MLIFWVGVKTTLVQHYNITTFECCNVLKHLVFFFFFFFSNTTFEFLKVFFIDAQFSWLNQIMTTYCLDIYVNCTYFVQKLSSGAICEQFMYNLRKSTKQSHVIFWVKQQPSLPLFTISNYQMLYNIWIFLYVVQH